MVGSFQLASFSSLHQTQTSHHLVVPHLPHNYQTSQLPTISQLLSISRLQLPVIACALVAPQGYTSFNHPYSSRRNLLSFYPPCCRAIEKLFLIRFHAHIRRLCSWTVERLDNGEIARPLASKYLFDQFCSIVFGPLSSLPLRFRFER